MLDSILDFRAPELQEHKLPFIRKYWLWSILLSQHGTEQAVPPSPCSVAKPWVVHTPIALCCVGWCVMV